MGKSIAGEAEVEVGGQQKEGQERRGSFLHPTLAHPSAGTGNFVKNSLLSLVAAASLPVDPRNLEVLPTDDA